MRADESHDEVVEHGRSSRTVGIAAAIAAGTLLLVVSSLLDSDPTPTSAPTAAAAERIAPSTTTGELPEFTLLGSAELPGRTVSFLRLPRDRNGDGGSVIHTLHEGELLSRQADRELTSIGRLAFYSDQPGERREYILRTERGTVVTASGTAEFHPIDLGAGVVALGEGFAALRGPDDDSVWLFTSAERSARLVDVRTGTERRLVDLESLNRVVDAAGDRLIARPTDDGRGFDLWTPDGTIELAGTAGLAYVGGANEVAVFADDTNLHVVDLADPSAAPRTIPSPDPAVFRTMVSPDGRLLAASIVTPITEPNPIVVVDLATGDVVHRIDEAIEALFQWSTPSSLLFLRPDWPAMDLVERDLDAGVDANLVGLEDLTWWYSAPERRDG